VTTTSLLAVAASILGVLLVAATSVGAWAALRVGKNTQTVANYREAAASWREKSDSQQAEIADLRQQLSENRTAAAEAQAAASTKVADLEAQVHVLQGVVTGRAQLEALGTELNTSVASIREQLATMHQDLVQQMNAGATNILKRLEAK